MEKRFDRAEKRREAPGEGGVEKEESTWKERSAQKEEQKITVILNEQST